MKGAVTPTRDHDYPLLKRVLGCQYVTQTQLWRFLHHDRYEGSRRSYDWRVKRLREHGYVTHLAVPTVSQECVYTIAANGVTYLVGLGEFYSGPPNGLGTEPEIKSVAHAVGLNDIHLRFHETTVVISWETETEIRSRNDLTTAGYKKDYDAVVTLVLSGQVKTFAPEYERTPKTYREYSKIRKRIETERRVDRFLYLVPNSHVQSFIEQCYRRINRPLYIGRSSELESVSPEDLEVLEVRTNRTLRLKDI
jgi:hypothetical protein